MRAKFVSSTNLGIEEIMTKDIYANISFGKTVSWILDRVHCFKTSMIERFEWNKNTRHLKVFTLNSIYEFELEKDTFRSNQIQCSHKEEIEYFRVQNEATLYEMVMIRVLTAKDSYEDGLYRLKTPMNFYNAKKLLVGHDYDHDGVQGKIIHIYPPTHNGWF